MHHAAPVAPGHAGVALARRQSRQHHRRAVAVAQAAPGGESGPATLPAPAKTKFINPSRLTRCTASLYFWASACVPILDSAVFTSPPILILPSAEPCAPRLRLPASLTRSAPSLPVPRSQLAKRRRWPQTALWEALRARRPSPTSRWRRRIPRRARPRRPRARPLAERCG